MNATTTKAAGDVFVDLAQRLATIARCLEAAADDGDILTLPALVEAVKVAGHIADRAAAACGAVPYRDEWFADAEVGRALRVLGGEEDATGSAR